MTGLCHHVVFHPGLYYVISAEQLMLASRAQNIAIQKLLMILEIESKELTVSTSENQTHSLSSIEAASEIVAAYISNNSVPVSEMPGLILSVYTIILSLRNGLVSAEPEPAKEPAVPIKKSVSKDFIICLEDGKKFKSLRRHLATLGLTPDEYREKWGLSGDYPMVAPSYAAVRSELAKKSGLGNGRRTALAVAKTVVRKKAA